MRDFIFDLLEGLGMVAGTMVLILVILALVAGFSILINKDWRAPK